jgi:hypothetical protein
VQRDLYSAFLAAYLSADHLLPSCAEVMSFPGKVRKRACGPHMSECNNVRLRGSPCADRFGCARAGARRPSSPSQPTQESAFLLT